MKRSSAGKWNGLMFSVRTDFLYIKISLELTRTLILANEEQSTLDLSLWFCQMLLHRTAARLQPEIDRLVPEICGNARLIISKFMQVRFPLALGLIDHVYSIVAYAAITLCDYNVSDPLIDQVRALLLHLAPSGDHISYRIACIIAEVQRRYSDAAADSASVASGGDALKDALFATPHPPRAANMDLAQLMPAAGVMNSLVDEYGCINQLIPSYAAPHPPFSGPTIFQQHLAPVTGGAMPVSLVPRALHDW
ncbi:Transcriptional activator of proteases prtT [Penicillium riverlandense]|uniref:Transcriptional activator of proteases prtT n=1 Tax=Penicillium riverlandense TaxID=1903569 RepID=UPI0025488108|nr:Transcriptional activator of proteases prtT [Penicillium riverlandense]KAJ5832981.1 Transcriptional activator of proteases prtT [Penicillium riverlandense]